MMMSPPLIKFYRYSTLKRLFILISILLFLIPLPVKAQDLAETIIEAPAFKQYFNEYYNALADYNVEDLRLELFETIEDILSSGSHLSTVSLDYKVRHIETDLLSHLQKALCNKQAKDSDLVILKSITVTVVENAGSDAKVQFNHEELGMLAGVTVRLVQQMSKAQLCNATE